MNKLVHCETNCETNWEEIGNETDATMVDLHIHRPTGLRRNLQRLCSVFGLEKDDKNILRSMFSSTSVFVPVYDREFQCEIAFSFWGFVKNDDTRTRSLFYAHEACSDTVALERTCFFYSQPMHVGCDVV